MNVQHGHKKLYGTATIGSKGQVVIPAEAREELSLKTGDRLYVIGAMNSGGVVFLKEEMLEDMLAHMTAQLENIRSLKDKTNK
jgi:AbrB family looped-hinge helix DNA binding protein